MIASRAALTVAFLLCGVPVIRSTDARAGERTAAAGQAMEMTALLAQPSYSPGQLARLRIVADGTRLTVQPIAAFS